MMNTETVAGDRTGKRSSRSKAEAEADGAPSARRGRFAHGVQALADLPRLIDEQVRTHPYRLLGIACAVGMGAGILVGSRVLRAVAANVASHALIELGRAYLRQDIG